ncbi:MAG: efflux RND transporter periplasmic adaptor subunit [Pyrinomonadaceae bacterium]
MTNQGRSWSRICWALLLISVLFNAGCKKGQQAQPNNSVPVTVGKAVQKEMPIEIRAIGNVQAITSVSVRAQVTGRLMLVHFKEGDNVRKGQLLFTLDTRPFEEAVKQAQADLQKSIAAQKQAEANLAKDLAQAQYAAVEDRRYQTLLDEGVVSREQAEQFRTNSEAFVATVNADKSAIGTAKAQVQFSQSAVDNAKVQLSYCLIRSPLDGRTGNLVVTRGNLVDVNDQTSLVVINQITPIYATFSVPESSLSNVKRYFSAGVLSVQAQPDTDPQHNRLGRLSFVDNQVNQTTGTIQLKAVFPNADGILWPGQFANIVLTLTKQPNALVVPAQAIQTSQQGTFVFVIKQDQTAEMRPIVVNRTMGNEAVIERGLNEGEMVVTDGQLRLVPGAKVQINANIGPVASAGKTA